MSRSKKKNPVTSITCCGERAGAHHGYKKMESQRKRARVRQLIKLGEVELLPLDKEFCNECKSPRDGQQWLSPENREKGMRK